MRHSGEVKSMKNFKLKYTKIADSVDRFILQWVSKRRYRIPLFILAILITIFISKAPYINLFLNNYLIFFFSAILSSLILDIGAEYFFTLAIILLLPMLVFSLGVYQKDEAKLLAEMTFILLASGTVRLLFSSD